MGNFSDAGNMRLPTNDEGAHVGKLDVPTELAEWAFFRAIHDQGSNNKAALRNAIALAQSLSNSHIRLCIQSSAISTRELLVSTPALIRRDIARIRRRALRWVRTNIWRVCSWKSPTDKSISSQVKSGRHGCHSGSSPFLAPLSWQAVAQGSRTIATMSSDPESKSASGSVEEKGSMVQEQISMANTSEIDLLEYHEHNAGRLVVDPEYVMFTT